MFETSTLNHIVRKQYDYEICSFVTSIYSASLLAFFIFCMAQRAVLVLEAFKE